MLVRHRHETRLRPEQKRLAELLLVGMSNAEIATETHKSCEVVKNRISELLDFSGMDDRVMLAIWLHERRSELGISCPCDFGMEPVAVAG